MKEVSDVRIKVASAMRDGYWCLSRVKLRRKVIDVKYPRVYNVTFWGGFRELVSWEQS